MVCTTVVYKYYSMQYVVTLFYSKYGTVLVVFHGVCALLIAAGRQAVANVLNIIHFFMLALATNLL